MALLLNLTGRADIAPLEIEADAMGPDHGPVVQVPGAMDADDIAIDLDRVEVLLIDFPAFTDGRGFTLATRLRAHCGFDGEIRAVGHFLPDQSFFLARCGFDTAILQSQADYDAAEHALKQFSIVTQSAPACPKPTVLHLRHGRSLKGSA